MARKKNKKMDFSSMEPLTSSPFAALGDKFGIQAKEETPPREEAPPSPGAKAMLLIRKEKRKHGRVATCIYHLGDEATALLKKLKSRLGTGGTVGEKCLEVQGDHREACQTFFEQQGYKVRQG